MCVCCVYQTYTYSNYSAIPTAPTARCITISILIDMGLVEFSPGPKNGEAECRLLLCALASCVASSSSVVFHDETNLSFREGEANETWPRAEKT